jgi:hypothetical protein
MFKNVARSHLYRRAYDRHFCVEALVVDPTYDNVNWSKANQDGFHVPYRWVTIFVNENFHVAQQFQKDFNNKHRLVIQHKHR